ncbi:hypothetical protein P7C73_g6144, partial [Tremellales sp. Uapishka_1]
SAAAGAGATAGAAASNSAASAAAASSSAAAAAAAASNSAASVAAASNSAAAAAAASNSAASVAAASSSAAAAAAASNSAASAAAASSSAAAAAASNSAASAAAASASAASASAASASVAAASASAASASIASASAAASSSSAAAAAASSAAAAAAALLVVNGYTAVGCLQEVPGRLLADVQTSSGAMTLEMCTNICFGYGYQVAGVEYGSECYCGNDADIANAAISGQCNMACPGNANEICGGPDAINAFYNPTVQPATVVLPTGWTTYGVVAEAPSGRTLTTTLWSDSSNTIESCANACNNAGYSVSGTEYSNECYCGNGFANGGGQLQDSSAAFMACGGNLAEMCGGPSILSVVSSLGTSIPSI